MPELQWEGVKGALEALLQRVDPEATTTKDIFRLLTEELGQGVKTFKTEIRETIAAFFEGHESDDEALSYKLSSTVTLSVVDVSRKKRVEIRQQDGKTVDLSGWDFCTFASKLEALKGALTGERDGFHIDLGPKSTATIVKANDVFEIEVQQHDGQDGASRIIESVIRMDMDALDELKQTKDTILQALEVLQAEETGNKRPLETEDAPPGKSRKTQKNDDVYVLELANNIRLTVSEFKGRMRTDIRRYYTDKTSKECRPTQKGLSMEKEQLKTFLDCFDDLKAAVKEQKTDYMIEIAHNRRVSVSDFTGRCLVDLREYYQDKTGGPPKPGKKGICFDVELLDVITCHINDIMTAMA